MSSVVRCTCAEMEGVAHFCQAHGWREPPILTPLVDVREQRRRRTGVIVGVDHVTPETAKAVRDALVERFPLVEFTVITGASSVAFEWDEQENEP